MSDISKINPNGTEYNLKDATARTNIGNLSNLETTEKTNLVGAINEVKSGLSDVNSNLLSRYCKKSTPLVIAGGTATIDISDMPIGGAVIMCYGHTNSSWRYFGFIGKHGTDVITKYDVVTSELLVLSFNGNNLILTNGSSEYNMYINVTIIG